MIRLMALEITVAALGIFGIPMGVAWGYYLLTGYPLDFGGQ